MAGGGGGVIVAQDVHPRYPGACHGCRAYLAQP